MADVNEGGGGGRMMMTKLLEKKKKWTVSKETFSFRLGWVIGKKKIFFFLVVFLFLTAVCHR